MDVVFGFLLSLEGDDLGFSHLFFADNLLLVVTWCLDWFCNRSGQKVNVAKPKCISPKHVCSCWRMELSYLLILESISPILHKRGKYKTLSIYLD